MKNRIQKWWNRTWTDWELFSQEPLLDLNYRKDWRIITTLISKSNDGLVRYKTIKNF